MLFVGSCALLQVPLYDLRSPLGVAPAALTRLQAQPSAAAAGGAGDTHSAAASQLLLKAVGNLQDTALPPSLLAAKAFAASRTELRAKVASSGLVGTADCLARMLCCVAGDRIVKTWRHCICMSHIEHCPGSCIT